MRRALLAAAAFALGGCVSTGQYDAAIGERDAAQERNAQLEASVAALTAERDAIAGELEDLRVAHEPVADAAAKLAAVEGRLPACETDLADKSAKLDQLQSTYEGLIKDLEAEVASSNSQIDQLREGLRMSLPAEVLFQSGSAELTTEGEQVLADLAKDLGRDAYAPYQIFVEGHTDGVAIRGPLAQRFPTNWELAGARAARVVRALEEAGVDGTKLAAVSRGERHPVSADDTPEGRAANRRIEIRLIPAQRAAPPATAAPAAAANAPAEPTSPPAAP